MSTQHEHFMKRSLLLAERGKAWVNPNPMVGSVVVKNGRIVGEGYHEQFGESHAEVNALREAGRRARGATLYVNLEPCVHYGRTPPCTSAIIEAGIRHVVGSEKDPNPLVSGKGFRALRRAGVRVTSGILRKEARKLNKKFFTAMETRLPFVGVKLAQTLDGRIADWKGHSKWISSPDARNYAHVLRTSYAAIMVGWRTVQMDNPDLTVRFVEGRNPTRVVLDGRFSITPSRRVCDTTEAQTIILTSSASLKKEYRKAVTLERKGVQVVGIDSDIPFKPRLVLKALFQMEITSVLIEGGSCTIGPFFDDRLVNRVHCFSAPAILGSGTTGFSFGRRLLGRSIRLDQLVVNQLGGNIILEGSPLY